MIRSIMAVCDDEAFRWRDALPAAGVLSVSVLGILFLASQPTPGEAQIAVFLPPWTQQQKQPQLSLRLAGP